MQAGENVNRKLVESENDLESVSFDKDTIAVQDIRNMGYWMRITWGFYVLYDNVSVNLKLFQD